MPKQRAALVIDYQNVHVTAHEIFNPHAELSQSLIDPLKFAREIERLKSNFTQAIPVSIEHIEVYRGLPDVSLKGHAYNTAQKAKWLQSVSPTINTGQLGSTGISPANMAAKKFPTMDVVLRPLKYKYALINGEWEKDIEAGGVEKGVDVLIALAVVRLATDSNIDTVILASQDSDLKPALETVVEKRLGHVETVRWFDEDNKNTWGRLGKVWKTPMDHTSYQNSLDTRNYSYIIHN